MGGIKKKQKGFRRPKQPFDKERIDEENGLIKKYGLIITTISIIGLIVDGLIVFKTYALRG